LFELDYVLAGLDAKRGRADSAQRRRHLFERMRHAFPGAEMSAPKDREYDYGLDDPDDGHVAHAAILGKADVIVTDDTRAGFRTSAALREATVEVVYPAEFAANTVSAHPDAGLRALTVMAARMTAPPRSPREVLAELQIRYEMDELAEILAPRLPAMITGPGRDWWCWSVPRGGGCSG
jgi:hypothetical protein